MGTTARKMSKAAVTITSFIGRDIATATIVEIETKRVEEVVIITTAIISIPCYYYYYCFTTTKDSIISSSTDSITK